jgi:thioredoxin-related protein
MQRIAFPGTRFAVACLGLTIFVLSAAASLVSGPRSQQRPRSVDLLRFRSPAFQWRTDFNQARQEAKERNRPILLLIRTKDCQWCDKLEPVLRDDPGLASLLANDWVPVRLFAEKNRALTEYLTIDAFPTIVLAAPEGRIFRYVTGYHKAAFLRDTMQRTVEQWRASRKGSSHP